MCWTFVGIFLTLIHFSLVLRLIADKNSLMKKFQSKMRSMHHECVDNSRLIKTLQCEVDLCKLNHNPLLLEVTEMRNNYNKLRSEYDATVNKIEIKYQNLCQEHSKCKIDGLIYNEKLKADRNKKKVERCETDKSIEHAKVEIGYLTDENNRLSELNNKIQERYDRSYQELVTLRLRCSNQQSYDKTLGRDNNAFNLKNQNALVSRHNAELTVLKHKHDEEVKSLNAKIKELTKAHSKVKLSLENIKKERKKLKREINSYKVERNLLENSSNGLADNMKAKTENTGVQTEPISSQTSSIQDFDKTDILKWMPLSNESGYCDDSNSVSTQNTDTHDAECNKLDSFITIFNDTTNFKKTQSKSSETKTNFTESAANSPLAVDLSLSESHDLEDYSDCEPITITSKGEPFKPVDDTEFNRADLFSNVLCDDSISEDTTNGSGDMCVQNMSSGDCSVKPLHKVSPSPLPEFTNPKDYYSDNEFETSTSKKCKSKSMRDSKSTNLFGNIFGDNSISEEKTSKRADTYIQNTMSEDSPVNDLHNVNMVSFSDLTNPTDSSNSKLKSNILKERTTESMRDSKFMDLFGHISDDDDDDSISVSTNSELTDVCNLEKNSENSPTESSHTVDVPLLPEFKNPNDYCISKLGVGDLKKTASLSMNKDELNNLDLFCSTSDDDLTFVSKKSRPTDKNIQETNFKYSHIKYSHGANVLKVEDPKTCGNSDSVVGPKKFNSVNVFGDICDDNLLVKTANSKLTNTYLQESDSMDGLQRCSPSLSEDLMACLDDEFVTDLLKRCTSIPVLLSPLSVDEGKIFHY